MGEANRKVYAEALHEAKDLLDRKQYGRQSPSSTP